MQKAFADGLLNRIYRNAGLCQRTSSCRRGKRKANWLWCFAVRIYSSLLHSYNLLCGVAGQPCLLLGSPQHPPGHMDQCDFPNSDVAGVHPAVRLFCVGIYLVCCDSGSSDLCWRIPCLLEEDARSQLDKVPNLYRYSQYRILAGWLVDTVN